MVFNVESLKKIRKAIDYFFNYWYYDSIITSENINIRIK